MSLERTSLALLTEAAAVLEAGFVHLPDHRPTTDLERLRPVLLEVARRLHDNYPYHHPLYAGQMLKPPHPVARLAYALAMFLNPNNHALDGGRASSAMEKEVVADLAAMVGWGPQPPSAYLGHLTGGGTLANLEGLWVARQVMGADRTIVASSQAHSTHRRMGEVLGVDFQTVAVDAHARMDPGALHATLAQEGGRVGTVVVTMGTTATGAVDPLPAILEMQQTYGFRVHVDAAYGGYYPLAENLTPEVRAAFDRWSEADSIAIDPHKHGLQPYGCGCILFRDPLVGRFYQHESPYTYFTSDELHLGEISLECSRAGASAVALWATHRLLPPVRGGEFARGLERGRTAALALYERLQADPRFIVPPSPPDLDIVVWAVRATSVAEASQQARNLFAAAEQEQLHLALVNLPCSLFAEPFPVSSSDDDDDQTVTCLRACLMKPEHLDWLETIWETITRVAAQVCQHPPNLV